MTQPDSPSSGGTSPNSPAPAPLNPQALTLEELAALLTRAGGGAAVTVEMLREDVVDGAPVLADGRVNLVHYAAWLVGALAEEDG